jgi:hypothetical protein
MAGQVCEFDGAGLFMAELFDPYHKWLGIRDKQRPPNHYRLLGLELFEDDADAISAAADQRMAHVRTYQLGPHSALSQQILNEIAAAKLCLLEPVKRFAYDSQLRGQPAPAPPPNHAQPPATTPSDDYDVRPITSHRVAQSRDDLRLAPEVVAPVEEPAAPPPGSSSVVWETPLDKLNRALELRPRIRAAPPKSRRPVWLVAMLPPVVSAIVLAIMIRFLLTPKPNASTADGSRPDSQAAASPASTRIPNREPEPSSPQPPATGRSTPENPATREGNAAATTRTATGKSNSSPTAAAKADEQDSGNRFKMLATVLPEQLVTSWRRSGADTANSDVAVCHEIAELAYANVALCALLQLPAAKNRSEDITWALGKIDDTNPFGGRGFAELAAPAPKTPASAAAKPKIKQQAWVEVDRCFDAYASAVTRLSSILEGTPSTPLPNERVATHVALTETLFRGLFAHALKGCPESKQGGSDAFRRLSQIEGAAAIDQFAAGTAIQQLCHWNLRICEVLAVLCECAEAVTSGGIAQMRQTMARTDFASGLEQLRSLLIVEMDLWAALALHEHRP